MAAISFVPERLARAGKFFAVCAVLLVCSVFLHLSVNAQQRYTLPDNPTFKPEVEVRQEDYAKARREFRTRLVQKIPSPQAVAMPKPPTGVTVVEFPSGGLRLKAWMNRPGNPSGGKIPAVIFLHGGFSFIRDHWEQAEAYRNAGFIVLTPILRGENGQAGNFTLLYDEVDDVLAAAEFLSRQPFVDADNIFIAGHSAGGTLALLASQASGKFRAVASFSGSPDQKLLLRLGFPKDEIPFDQADPREFQMRSPLAYATSFKSPTRIYYGSLEPVFDLTSRRAAELAKEAGLDVEAVVTQGNHESHVPDSVRQSIEFFDRHLSAQARLTLKARSIPETRPCLAGNATFRLKGFEDAQAVTLAGSFNGWNPQKYFLIKETGGWVCRVDLAPGKHFYKFVVDREWIVDPANPVKADDGNGNVNSVLVINP
jgi:dienelactone hydrolase